jgi:Transglycosylase SLT domain
MATVGSLGALFMNRAGGRWGENRRFPFCPSTPRRSVTARGVAGDRGATMTVLLLYMALGLCFATILLFRLGHANSLRTTAEQAADAGALGAATEIRDRGALQIVRGALPYGIIFKDSSRGAAGRYVDLNDGVVDNVHASGLFGTTVRVDAHSKECQNKLRDLDKDAPAGRIVCHNPKLDKDTDHGKAHAVAEVRFIGNCTVQPRPGLISLGNGPGEANFSTMVVCDGEPILTLPQAKRLFKVRLVDAEKGQAFIPALFNAIGAGPIPPGGVQNEDNRRLGRQLAAGRGWTGAEWECLDQLWQHESGWNHLAVNQSSGAYGITQALPASKMATAGADWQRNPATQIRWGLGYIGQRYGSPCGAWAWWQRTDPRPFPCHWY